jgi:predicted nucleic acid-binding protein
MNKSFILDTNILIYFFDGNDAAGKLIREVQYNVSSITHIELLSNANASRRELITEFLSGTTIIHTNPAICEFAINFRLNYKIKTPDAIIAATAKYLGFTLITADAQLFQIKEIEIIKFSK